MGFLKDVGRSGAVGLLGSSILSDALRAGQFMQSSREGEMREALTALQIQKMQEEEARQNRTLDLHYATEKSRAAGRGDEVSHFFDFARSVPGMVDVLEGPGGERIERISYRNFRTASELYASHLETNQKELQIAGWHAVTGAMKRREMAEATLAGLKGTATPADREAAAAALAAAKKEESETAERYQLMKTGNIAGGRSASWHVAPDKSSTTGWGYRDLNTGRPGGPAPAPRSEAGLTESQRATLTLQTRKEFEGSPVVKEFFTIRTQLGKMEKALDESKRTKTMVAVDQALITMFNKMTDPNSVVRESEYARTPSDQAVVNQLRGKWDKVLTGGAGLTDTEREAIVRMARIFGSIQQGMYDEHADYYRAIAAGTGLNPAHVVKPEKYNRRIPKADGGGPVVVETRQTPDGRILEKLSDGTIRERK